MWNYEMINVTEYFRFGVIIVELWLFWVFSNNLSHQLDLNWTELDQNLIVILKNGATVTWTTMKKQRLKFWPPIFQINNMENKKRAIKFETCYEK